MDQKNVQLKQLIYRAGQELLRLWPGNYGDQEVPELIRQNKTDGSLVTTADFASNQILIDGLKALYPEDSILSEEIPEASDLKHAARIWIIDPLDGTHHFSEGIDDFSVLVGLAEQGAFTHGYMYFPARDAYLEAHLNQETRLNGRPVKVSTAIEPGAGKVYTRHFEYSEDQWKYPEALDSGMAFFCLCAGELDGVVIRMKHHKIWDIAAPTVAILASGGMVTDEKGQDLNFSLVRDGIKFLVASNGLCHKKLIEALPAD